MRFPTHFFCCDFMIFADLENVAHISLKPYNTFGVDAQCEAILPFHNVDELKSSLNQLRAEGKRFMVLGGGSNVLFAGDYKGTVLLNRISGIKIIQEDKDSVVIEAGSGEEWHDLVLHCVNHGFGGIENLSLIPGCVGAAPIQNIGAYGVELKDVFESLTAVDIESGKTLTFEHSDCQFAYRDSIFKRDLKARVVIASVQLRLNKKPVVNTTYGAIREVLQSKSITIPDIRDVSMAVIEIRTSKLPDPSELGNSGSFFKNPVISRYDFQKIQNDYPGISGYTIDDDHVKVAAGWLIEQCGLKGKRFGNTGCHAKQALVIVNYGNASGQEIHEHALRVRDAVKERFGIELEMEVNVVF